MVERGSQLPHEQSRSLERVGRYYAQETHIPGVRLRVSSPYATKVPEDLVDTLYGLAVRHEQTKGIIHRASTKEKRIKHDLRGIAERYPLLRGIESNVEDENFYLNITPTREWRKKLLMKVMGTRFFSIAVGDVVFQLRYPVGTFKSAEEVEMKRRNIVDAVTEQGYEIEDAENMVSYHWNEVKIDDERFSEVARQLRGRLRMPRKAREIKTRTIKSDSINKGLRTLSEITRRKR